MQDTMITRDLDAFFAFAREAATDFGQATARAAFLVAPDGFALAEQSAQDNVYMADAAAFDFLRDRFAGLVLGFPVLGPLEIGADAR